MKHWKILSGLLALISVSLYVGLRVGQELAHRQGRRVAAEAWPDAALRGLDRKLKLSPRQRERIQLALDHTIGELKGIRQQALAETSVVIKELVAAVEAELTPEQQKIFATQKPTSTEITLDLLKVEPRKK